MFCASIEAGMSAGGGGTAKGRSVAAPPSGAGKEGRVGAAIAAAAPPESSFSFLICMPSFSTMMSTAVLALRGDGVERSGGCTVSSLELDEDPEQNTVLLRTVWRDLTKVISILYLGTRDKHASAGNRTRVACLL
jgi:hypothetical protein